MVDKMKLYNADCLPAMKEMPDNKFSLAIVDPPYGIGADVVQNKISSTNRISNGGKWKTYKKTNWDNKIPSLEYFKELFRVAKAQIIWGGNYFPLPPCCKWIVWNKIQRNYMTDGEMAWTSLQGQVSIFDMSRADAYINHCDIKIHPTQKPVALYKWLLTNYAKPGQTILDTHGGSGSIAIACYDLELELTAYEIDKEYIEAATNRIKGHIRQGNLFIMESKEKQRAHPEKEKKGFFE